GVQIGTAAAAGQVLVFNGDVQNISRTASVAVSQASPGILGSTAEENDRFGLALAAGDFDGDGKSDLAIGVPREDFGSVINVGIVHVLYGTSSVAAGLSLNRNQFFLASTLGETDEGGAQFGKTLAAGDFNGDGKADLAIGVPLKDVAGVSDAGQVHVIYGSGSGLSTFLTRSPQIWRQTTSGVGLTAEAGDRFGSSLTAWNFGHTAELGVARPATADLAIGIPFKDVGTHSDAGAVLVLYGCFTCNGLIAGFNQLWTQVPLPGGPEKDDHFGSALY
ncbi:MAG: hypothetical protein DMG14_03330, partial [Acidobacteria bacterium]